MTIARRLLCCIAYCMVTTTVACAKPTTPAPPAGTGVGNTAPAFAAHTLDGTPASLASLRGQVVVLNEWATWCEPCRAELPLLESLHRQYGKAGVTIVGVSIDGAGAESDIRDFARTHDMSYAIWTDPDDDFSLKFASSGVPVTIIIGRDGIIRWRHLGALSPNDGTLASALRAALAPS